MRAAQLLCLAASITSCSLWPDSEFPPGGGQRISERPEYLMWWKLVEECAGRRHVMDVEWYTTNGRVIEHKGQIASGIYRSYPDRIAVAHPDNGPVVRHEMLHAILQRTGHPPGSFGGTCGGFVEYNAPPEFGMPSNIWDILVAMRADSALKISVETYPATPSLSKFGGKYALFVKLTNTTDKYVRVGGFELLAQYTDAKGVREFRRGIASQGYLIFAPRQTRNVILDAQVFEPGAYNIVASFARARSASTPLTLVP